MPSDCTVCLVYCNSALEINCFIEKFCLAFFRTRERMANEMIRICYIVCD